MLSAALDDPEGVGDDLVEERGPFLLVNGLHPVVTVVIEASLQLYIQLMTGARDEGEQREVPLQLYLNNSAAVLHQLLHLQHYEPICVQLKVLSEGLVFLLLDKAPHVVAQASDALLDLLLRPGVVPQVRELVTELVEAVDEVLDKTGLPGVRASEVGLDKVLLHVSQALEHELPLFPHLLEHLQALPVILRFEVLPDPPL